MDECAKDFKYLKSLSNDDGKSFKGFRIKVF